MSAREWDNRFVESIEKQKKNDKFEFRVELTGMVLGLSFIVYAVAKLSMVFA